MFLMLCLASVLVHLTNAMFFIRTFRANQKWRDGSCIAKRIRKGSDKNGYHFGRKLKRLVAPHCKLAQLIPLIVLKRN